VTIYYKISYKDGTELYINYNSATSSHGLLTSVVHACPVRNKESTSEDSTQQS
jgi:hypothetical protein